MLYILIEDMYIKETGMQIKHTEFITKKGTLEQNKLKNKRLTQDFFVGSKKSITSHRTERKLGKG